MIVRGVERAFWEAARRIARIILGPEDSLRACAERSRGDDERPVRTGERRRHGLDRRAICFGGCRKVREVVDEAEVHDAVGQ